MWPHRRQPTRLHRPWDSPGKNTGVGCHFLLQCMKVKSESEVAQSCWTLSDPMDCSLPGSSVHGTFQQEYWGGLPLPFPPFPARATQIIVKLPFLVATESFIHMECYIEAQSVKQIGYWRRLWRSRVGTKEAFPSGVPCWTRSSPRDFQSSDSTFSSCSVLSASLQPHELQHSRPPYPSPTPGVHPNPCPLSRWYHPTISPSVVPFSSCPPSFPASGSFQMSQLLALGGQSMSFSFNISPSNEHSGLISLRMDWLDLLVVQGTLKSLLQL